MMVDEPLVQLLGWTFVAGVIGSLLAGITGWLSKDERLRLGNSMGIGFLVGAGIGATIAVFASLTGRF